MGWSWSKLAREVGERIEETPGVRRLGYPGMRVYRGCSRTFADEWAWHRHVSAEEKGTSVSRKMRKEVEHKGRKRRKKRKRCVCVCEGGPKTETKTRRIGRRTGTSWASWLTLVVIFGWWITMAETKGFGNEETMCIMKS